MAGDPGGRQASPGARGGAPVSTVASGALGDVLAERFAAQRQAVLDVVHEQALRGVVRVMQTIEATPNKPVDTGYYRHSISADLDDDGADVGSDAPYAAVIEYGARPFWPPFEPIYRWVLRKFRVRFNEQAKAVRGASKEAKAHAREVEAAKIARAIQRAIAVRGLQPKFVFQRATAKMRDDLGMALKNLRLRPGFQRIP